MVNNIVAGTMLAWVLDKHFVACRCALWHVERQHFWLPLSSWIIVAVFVFLVSTAANWMSSCSLWLRGLVIPSSHHHHTATGIQQKGGATRKECCRFYCRVFAHQSTANPHQLDAFKQACPQTKPCQQGHASLWVMMVMARMMRMRLLLVMIQKGVIFHFFSVFQPHNRIVAFNIFS